MKTIWHIRGPLAGTFQKLPDAEADAAAATGDAQVCDGTKLEYPETHPHYAGKKRGRKKKYPNKMMTSDDTETVSAETD